MSRAQSPITPDRFDAVLFDLDGVLTDTAKIHAACWKKMFDEFLQKWAARTGEPFLPFDSTADYQQYVDGKLRLDGVRSFLASRRIQLPEGDTNDPMDKETILGLGNRKNALVQDTLATEGVDVYAGSIDFVHRIRRAGLRAAIVSASRNCTAVLAAAGITDLFDVQIDGNVATRLQLAGKPAPDTFLTAARQLSVAPARAVVVEDAVSGVQAGRAGQFGLVIGVARHDNAAALQENGADIVVTDLRELL